MSAQPKHRYTLDEYLELDRNSDERLEFWNGEIFSMSGANDPRDRIEVNLTTFLNLRLSDKGCRVLSANMRIKVPSLPPYRYGDLSALCGEARFEKIGGVDALTNPSLIIEILSDSTEAFDRGDKFTHYKSIPTFREYLLISQKRPHVTQLFKTDDGVWTHHEFNDPDDVVKLKTVGCEVTLREVYFCVVFDPPVNSPSRI